MGYRIVLLVPYENAKEDYEDRVAIVTRARNMVHKFENRIDSMFRCGIGRVKVLGSVKEWIEDRQLPCCSAALICHDRCDNINQLCQAGNLYSVCMF